MTNRPRTLLLIFAASAAVGCSDNSAVIAPEVTVLGDDQLAHATVDATHVALPMVDGAWTKSLGPGSILASARDDGLLRTVMSTSVSNGQWIATTRNASLEEAIERGDVAVTRSLDELGEAPSSDGLLRPSSLGAGIDLSGTKLFEDEESGLEIVIDEGKIQLTPKLDVAMHFKDKRVHDFHAILTGKLSAHLSVKASVSKAFDASGSKVIWKSTPVRLVQWVGTLPVVEVITLSIEAGYDVSALAEVTGTVGVEAEADLSAGATYANGRWSPVGSAKVTFSPIGPSWEQSANLTVSGYLEPRLDIKLYGVAGPYIAVKPEVDFTGELLPPPISCSLSGAVSGEFGGEIEALGKTLAHYDGELFKYDHEIWSCDRLQPPDAGGGCDVASCPGHDQADTVTTCNAGDTCSITCDGEAYDVDGDAANGCEAHDLPVQDSPATATLVSLPDSFRVTPGDCDGSSNPCSLAQHIYGDDREHQTAPTMRHEGRDDWYRVEAAGVAGNPFKACLGITNFPKDDDYEVCVSDVGDNTPDYCVSLVGGEQRCISPPSMPHAGTFFIRVEKLAGTNTPNDYALYLEH